METKQPSMSSTGLAAPNSPRHKALPVSGSVSHSQMKTRASPPLEGNRAKSKLYPNGSSTSCQKQMGTPKVRDLKAHRQYFSVPREPPGGKPNTPDTPPFPGLTGAPTYLHVVTLPGTQLWARRVLRDGQR